jgi:hypothetical protein
MSTLSYVPPYTLISATVGGLLSYATEKPIFIIASIPIGIGCGMVRNNNAERPQANSFGTSLVKSTALYVLGPPLLIITVIGGIILSFKS